MKIFCPICQNLLKKNDSIVMTELYTLMHRNCTNIEYLLFKDTGTFEEILNKYSIFVDFH